MRQIFIFVYQPFYLLLAYFLKKIRGACKIETRTRILALVYVDLYCSPISSWANIMFWLSIYSSRFNVRSKLLNKCSRFLKIVMNNFLLDFVAFGAVLSGVLVITSTNPVISVLFLISVFINAAGYLLLLGVGFIGISYLIVYIGAIAILFLFVVMMLNIRLVEIVSVGTEYTKNLPLGLIVGSLFFFEILSIVPASTASSLTNVPLEVFNYINGLLFSGLQQLDSNSVHVAFTGPTADNSFTNFLQIETIGQGLYTYGSIWLLLASVILLLAMVGPITLCLRSTREN